jgi:hypothetical protein
MYGKTFDEVHHAVLSENITFEQIERVVDA